MKIAVEGCCHGELDKIYETIAHIEEKEKYKVDLLLICGDFQAIRNKSDFHALAVPPKYRQLNTFYKYYSGEKKAPVLTVVIGGNHEASNYMQELLYGGWLAPNIYYMGYAGVVQFGGIRIGGLSGIYKGRDYHRGHFEHPPYNEDTKRSCYHVRNLEVFRLKQLKKPLDIMLSHDWPRNIYHHGNLRRLLRQKQHFREEVESSTLGSPPAEEILHKIKPTYWFAAHLHVKFAAKFDHQVSEENPDRKTTKFLSLDKCLPRRQFLQILDIPHDAEKPLELELDPEWLCILRTTNHLLNLTRTTQYMPGLGSAERWDFTVTEEEIQDLRETFGDVFKIPDNFEPTAPAHSDSDPENAPPPQIAINPQTTLMCQMLDLTDPNAVFTGRQSHSLDLEHLQPHDSSDSLLDTDDEGIHNDSDYVNTTVDTSAANESTFNPDEISLDTNEDDDDDVDSSKDDPVNAPGGGSSPPASEEDASPGSSKKLSLPEPTQDDNSAESSLLVGSDPDDHNLSRDSDASLKRGVEESEEVLTSPEQHPQQRKFKRRNIEVYASQEEDS